MRTVLALILTTICLVSTAEGAGALPRQPNDREWNLITSDYQWLETQRKAMPVPPPTASRKQQIELLLDNHRKLEEQYLRFMDKVHEYYTRTSDARAAQVMAHEKIMMGDEYMNYLARYDRALDFYRSALQIDPASTEAKQRIALAEQKRFVSMDSFAAVKHGMKEDEVRKMVGLPREDWIKQVVQNGRVFAVWIYPKADGGASAVYFDNGLVYHTNWNAAAPPAQQTAK